MKQLSVQVPDDMAEAVDNLSDEHDTSRAAILRNLLDNGLRCRKYYPDEFPVTPERYEQRTAPDLARDGDLPR